MFATYSDLASGPGHLEGLSAFEAFLVENVDNAADETSGDVEAPTGWFALCGRHIVTTDDRGFWYVERCATRADAADVFGDRDTEYSAWIADE